jgi:hypothetical protein
MFSFSEELADVTVLHEGFTLSQLWLLREELNSIIEDLEEVKRLAIDICDKDELVDAEKKLFFLYRNVNIVEEAMMCKETQIFEFLMFEEFCLN